MKPSNTDKERRRKRSHGFRFSLNVAFSFYLFQNEPMQREGKAKKKIQFLEADPGNSFQSKGIEQHVDSLQKFTAL